MSLINKFGNKGEAPKQFKPLIGSKPILLYFYPDQIQVNSFDKLSYFTLDGNFIKEKKITSFFQYPVSYIIPFKNKFIVHELKGESRNKFWRQLSIYNSNLEKEKEILRIDIDKNEPYKLLDKTISIKIYEDSLFIISSRYFVIDVFDLDGKKKYSITRNYKNIKLTPENKEEIIKNFGINPSNKNIFPLVKDKLKCPDTFPVISELYIVDGIIYVLTYNRKDINSEFYVMDLNGNNEKRIWAPVRRDSPTGSLALYTINQGKSYQLVEETEREEWILFIESILNK